MTIEAEHTGREPARDPAGCFLGWSVVAVALVFAWWGWLANGFDELTLLIGCFMGVFQGLTNWFAVQVRHMARREAWATLGGCLVFMVFSGFLTHESLVNAYAVASSRGLVTRGTETMELLLVAVPFVEPFIFWVREIKREPLRVATMPRNESQGLVQRFFGMPAIQQPRDATAHQRGVVTRRRANAATVGLVAASLSQAKPRRAAEMVAKHEERPVATRAPPLSEQEMQTAVAELTRRGELVSLRRIARLLDVPMSRVERSPGRHLMQAA